MEATKRKELQSLPYEQRPLVVNYDKPKRDEKGRLLKGYTANVRLRTTVSPEKLIIKRAVKELIKDYKETLAESLPKISKVLTKLAIRGDIQAIREVNDRVIGRPDQKSENLNINVTPIPILGSITDNSGVYSREEEKKETGDHTP